MIEQHIILEGIDAVSFYGANNTHLMMLKKLFPKLRIVARDYIIKAVGDEEELDKFRAVVDRLIDHCTRYNSIDEEAIIDAVNGKKSDKGSDSNVIVYNINGKPIYPRSENQCKLVEEFGKNDMIFAVGPAGTGKTYTAIALAVRALKNREIRKIILSRPAVEAGEKLGFLPGDMREKIDPYLQPLYDALEDMIPGAKLKEYMDTNVIQIAPLAFMRGRTLNDAIVILDEAQNTTPQQIKMFLTRMGNNTKMVITGDLTQVDLPHNQGSGLTQAIQILKDVKGISFITLSKKDIVRHKLVTRIVDAYESYEKEKETSK
ncbi:MAG: PhoH family protein [Bacteroidaceae bacterium]|nr:PhoH family protein [Bacteroidaceae bacterium]MBQ5817562.1 PhoH family protein [Bacteroidaceae bacterium]